MEGDGKLRSREKEASERTVLVEVSCSWSKLLAEPIRSPSY